MAAVAKQEHVRLCERTIAGLERAKAQGHVGADPRLKLRPLTGAVSISWRHLLRRVLERMNNLEDDLDLQSLANETGYSRSHFVRMFHAATGKTPHNYVLDLRLTQAKNLLQERRTPLIDIAALCGFSSQAHMATVFRQKLGVTPSEYRRAV